MASTTHPEPTHIAGLRLAIEPCFWQWAGCNGAGGYLIWTSEVIEPACSRCAEVARIGNPDDAVVTAVAG